MKHPLSKLMHIDFRKWREAREVLIKTADGKKRDPYGFDELEDDEDAHSSERLAYMRTARCPKCRKVGLETVRYSVRGFDHTGVGVPWFIHIAIVDTLGTRLLPHKACAPRGMGNDASKAPIVFVPKAEIETRVRP